jgi:hypothetical protein
VAYLPDNPAVELDLSGFGGILSGKWLNPVTGNYDPPEFEVNPRKSVLLRRPEGFEDAGPVRHGGD